LKRGDIHCVKETVIYGRALQTQIDYLTARIQTVSAESRMKVWNALAIILPPDEKRKIANVMNGDADRVFIDTSSSDEESEGGDTLVEMEEEEIEEEEIEEEEETDADTSRSSSFDSRTTHEASLPAAAEDSSSMGDWDNRSLGSYDSNLNSRESSVGKSDEESSSVEEPGNGNEVAAGSNEGIDRSRNEVEDAPEGVQPRRSTRTRAARLL
jgi:hypothetical protein